MKKVIFIVPALSNSHFKNRLLEFNERGLDFEVYGFLRAGQKAPEGLPYKFESLGTVKNKSYKERLSVYIKSFRSLGKKYKNQNVVFYLFDLDIAAFFHYINPSFKYIYDECDLVHTYLKKGKGLLESLDKHIIKKSLLTVTTSQGFIDYHFGDKCPDNVVLVENKLNPDIQQCKAIAKKEFSKDRIEIGFVGAPRFDSVYNFIEVFCKNFSNGIFHVFGGPIKPQFEPLKKYPNCIFHGFFKNPVDLPDIYSKLDVVVATYDARYENVRYAEPNKIYESIYFETPIVVSSGTFLAEKVKKLGIGYDIDAMNDDEIIKFVSNLSEESLREKKKNAQKIDKRETLNINEDFFKKLDNIINTL